MTRWSLRIQLGALALNAGVLCFDLASGFWIAAGVAALGCVWCLLILKWKAVP